jgi:hypothetical protein
MSNTQPLQIIQQPETERIPIPVGGRDVLNELFAQYRQAAAVIARTLGMRPDQQFQITPENDAFMIPKESK